MEIFVSFFLLTCSLFLLMFSFWFLLRDLKLKKAIYERLADIYVELKLRGDK